MNNKCYVILQEAQNLNQHLSDSPSTASVCIMHFSVVVVSTRCTCSLCKYILSIRYVWFHEANYQIASVLVSFSPLREAGEPQGSNEWNKYAHMTKNVWREDQRQLI